MILTLSRGPGTQAFLFKPEGADIQPCSFKVLNQIVLAERRNIKEKKSPTAGTQQFSANSAVG